MATNRTIVSRIRSMHKLLSSDNSINDRTVLQEAKSSARMLIKQRLDKRQLFNTPTIFTPIDCLELESVSIAECCDYVSEKQVGRSKYKLPKIGEGAFGLAIQGVFSVDGNKKLKETTPSRYSNSAKLGLTTPDLFYWVYNEYLYVSNADIKVVKIIAYFEDDIPDDIRYATCECTGSKPKDCNHTPMDDEFKCPGYLEDTVVKMVSQYLLSTYFKIPEDKTSNYSDEQVNKN